LAELIHERAQWISSHIAEAQPLGGAGLEELADPVVEVLPPPALQDPATQARVFAAGVVAWVG
jgi:hypothetical protein